MFRAIKLSIVLVLFLVLSSQAAIKIGQVVRYNGKIWVVKKITQKKTVVLCPQYDYTRYFNGSDWGWFYNSTCITVPLDHLNPHKKHSPSAPNIQQPEPHKLAELARNPKYLNSLTAKQFNKMYKQITQIAVMHPTEENVKAYMFMTNFLRLKALVFAHSVSDYVLKNPKYNMDKDIGYTSWSTFNYRKITKNKRKQFITQHKDSMGLMVFIKNGCPYCMKQIPVLTWFKSDYGVDALLVSQNGCPVNTMGLPCVNKPETFSRFNIQYEPTILFVIKKKNGQPAFYPIGSGLTTEETIVRRIYYYANIYYKPHERYTDKNFLRLLEEGK